MKVVFRVDASIEIGAGHVMRCLTLAVALKKSGAECFFICRNHTGNLINKIEENKFKVHILDSTASDACSEEYDSESDLMHSEWLGTDQFTDAHLCTTILSEIKPDLLVVDHYGIDFRWQSCLNGLYRRLLIIDDLADRKHLADILIDQTFLRNEQDYEPLVPPNCKLLCGTSFALLRPEFSQWRNYSLQRRKNQNELQRILISLGGVDKDNLTSDILASLAEIDFNSSVSITVVVGITSPWLDQIKLQIQSMSLNVQVQANVGNMAELMANTDLAIGAAGATSWERCALGVPTILVVLAENQKMIARSLDSQSAVRMLERANIKSELPRIIRHLDSKTLKSLSSNAAKICDGHGVDKVLEIITEATL